MSLKVFVVRSLAPAVRPQKYETTKIKSILLIILISYNLFSQDNYMLWIRQQNVPSEVNEAFKITKADSTYIIIFDINPFYLRGDFNGDNIHDYAVLIMNRVGSEIGIAIIHGGSKKMYILGAGEKFGNGGRDFQWMNAWHIYPKGKVYQGASEDAPPVLKGEALIVSCLESASGLIYWTGKEYKWYQQGD
jgi:hypothetical protein